MNPGQKSQSFLRQLYENLKTLILKIEIFRLNVVFEAGIMKGWQLQVKMIIYLKKLQKYFKFVNSDPEN